MSKVKTGQEAIELKDILKDTIELSIRNLETAGEGAAKIVYDARKNVATALSSAGDSIDDLIAQTRKANKESADWLRREAAKLLSR